MRITDVNIDYSLDKYPSVYGIESIKMNKLNQCVIIVGKNGAGKTRLLKMIKSQLEMCPYIMDDRDIINEVKVNIDKLPLKFDTIYNIQNNDKYKMIPFVPIDLEIRDCSNDGKKSLSETKRIVFDVGIEKLKDNTYAYIQAVQDSWFNATHPISTVSDDIKNKAINEYKELIKNIFAFLGCEVKRDINNNATLFGLPLTESNISNGQKIILQYCIAIHTQKANLNDHILVMDEPENHLHPSILIELIENIKKYNKNGQIWIATHSIPLISYFDSQDIWYMEDSNISKYGKVSEKVLKNLIGNNDQIEKLKDFINLPAIQAVNRYTFESLFPPKIKDTDSNDPQTRQIHSAIEKFIKPDGKIKILDYGAGKGRILNCVEDSKDLFKEKVEYFAFDKYSDNKEECLFSIGNLYESPETRYFNNEKELRSKHDEYSFDIVIMSNVLHEICPNDWLKLFGNNGFITKTLKKAGILLLVEDYQLPYGEKAYQNGFLVLDTPELKKLFNISSEEKDFSWDDFYEDGRLKAHRIPQPYLENVTNFTRIAALNELKENAIREITELRKKDEKNYKNGRLSGFWIHQLCNVELVLIELEGS